MAPARNLVTLPQMLRFQSDDIKQMKLSSEQVEFLLAIELQKATTERQLKKCVG